MEILEGRVLGGGYAARNGVSLKLTDYNGSRDFEKRGDNYLFEYISGSGGDKLYIQNGDFIIRDYNSSVRYKAPPDTVLAEISQKKNSGMEYFKKTFGVPIAVRSDRKQGLDIGITAGFDSQQTTWSLAGSLLKVNCLSLLESDLSKQVAYLPIVNATYWPRIYPDAYAGAIPKKS